MSVGERNWVSPSTEEEEDDDDNDDDDEEEEGGSRREFPIMLSGFLWLHLPTKQPHLFALSFFFCSAYNATLAFQANICRCPLVSVEPLRSGG